jgi:hypothetical protein
MEDFTMDNNEQDNRRFFLGPDEETKYYIDTPSAEDIRGADWQYSKTYTQCLIEGITTSAEMVDILTRRGIIGPEFEQRASELSGNLNKAISELDTAEDMDIKREVSMKVAQAREELFQWNQRLNGPMNNTAEQMSDDARLEFLTSCMVVDGAGNKVWDSYDTYLKEKSQALALRARFEVMLFLQGLDSNFLEQTPEAIAMREVEADILEKAEAALRASEAVEKEEEMEAERAKAEEKPKEVAKKKPTRGRPKKDSDK